MYRSLIRRGRQGHVLNVDDVGNYVERNVSIRMNHHLSIRLSEVWKVKRDGLTGVPVVRGERSFDGAGQTADVLIVARSPRVCVDLCHRRRDREWSGLGLIQVPGDRDQI